MHHRRRLSLLIAVSLLFVLGGTSRLHAQNAPPPLPMNLIGATQLTEAQTAQLNVWVSHWAGSLNTTADPAEVERARAQLITPLSQPDPARMVSPAFRRSYSQAATPEMKKAVGSGDLHRATNALLVLSQLGDEGAATALLDIVDPQAQPVWQVRLRAASAICVLMQRGTLDARKIGATTRELRDVAMREDNGLVLTHLLLAINAADAEAVPEKERTDARKFLVEAMASIADRLAAGNDLAVPMLYSFATALDRLRPRLLRFPGDQPTGLAQTLGPALLKVIFHVQAHWEDARANAASHRDIETVVGACEAALQTVDSIIRRDQTAPATEMKNAWIAGDKAKFEAGVTAWQDLLSKPPYGQ